MRIRVFAAVFQTAELLPSPSLPLLPLLFENSIICQGCTSIPRQKTFPLTPLPSSTFIALVYDLFLMHNKDSCEHEAPYFAHVSTGVWFFGSQSNPGRCVIGGGISAGVLQDE